MKKLKNYTEKSKNDMKNQKIAQKIKKSRTHFSSDLPLGIQNLLFFTACTHRIKQLRLFYSMMHRTGPIFNFDFW